MDIKTTVSAKGQVVIPKAVREMTGLHYGSELLIHVRPDDVLEFKPVKKNLSGFFGMGAGQTTDHYQQTPIDVDRAIAEAVSSNNPASRKNNL